MREVAIVGAGMTAFGEAWESSLRDLFAEAALEALMDAGVDRVDSIYVGNMSGGQFVGQEHLGPLMADYLGMTGVASARVESACASGGLALRQAFIEVASGFSDLVLAAGVEKMTDGADVTSVLATASDQENEVYHGVTFPGLFAMIARAHMMAYGTTDEDMAWVSVKNHRHGALNPKAQFQREITVDDVLSSAMVAEPIRLLHCSPISDGGAAVLLCPLDQAKQYTDRPVKIVASGMATDSMALAHRENLTVLKSVQKSAERAFRLAGVGPQDIQVAEGPRLFPHRGDLCRRSAWPGGARQGRTGGSGRAHLARRPHPGKHERRPQVQRPSRRSHRRRPGDRDIQAASGRGRRTSGRERAFRSHAEYGGIGSQLCGPHLPRLLMPPMADLACCGKACLSRCRAD